MYSALKVLKPITPSLSLLNFSRTGIHVLTGAGDVNVTDCRIAFNTGDGMNVSYSGGSTNVTRSTFSSNLGYGVAVWINDTKDPEYIQVHQETAVAYSEVR